MSDKIKTLQEITTDISMPKYIKIGDPLYFEDGEDLDKLVYDKHFRGKENWVGKLILAEHDITSKYEGRKFNYKDISIKVIFAPDNRYLNIYINNGLYANQKRKSKGIGVDTACYLMNIDNREITIHTGADGFFGGVYEIYNHNKLEGILIGLSASNINEFEVIQEYLEYLFNSKF